ncbi:MAG: hypothetical protein RLZZ191_1575, partial [Pseudomonadota bacterium]
KLVARKPGVVAGVVVAATVFDLVSQHEATCNILIPDGMPVVPGDVILEVTGRTQALLTAERTALNLLCHLSGIATATSAEHVAEEIGDLLFAVVNFARFHDVDAETALKSASAKFERRFRDMEDSAGARFTSLSLDEKEDLWQQAKAKEAK